MGSNLSPSVTTIFAILCLGLQSNITHNIKKADFIGDG